MNYNNFEESYQKLNQEQKKAVDAIDGPVLVVAGPGTGKTQLLSNRVANILAKTDTSPQSILCLTFTDSASYNMRERLVNIIGSEAYKVNIHTFHSLCVDIINQNPEYFFFGSEYDPTDEVGQIKIMQDLFENLDLANPLKSFHPQHGFTYLKDALSTIQHIKTAGLLPENFLEVLEDNQNFSLQVQSILQGFFEQNARKIKEADFVNLAESLNQVCQENLNQNFSKKVYQIQKPLSYFLQDSLKQVLEELQGLPKFKTTPITNFRNSWVVKDEKNKFVLKNLRDAPKLFALQKIYQDYQEKLHGLKLYDFSDMILEVNKLFASPQGLDLKYNYQEKFLYILLDEFQDTNPAQLELVMNFLNMEISEGRPNIMAVGDDDQSIFKFQGASSQNILTFMEWFKNPVVVNLTTNYRSYQNILNFASNVIQQSQHRACKTLEIDKNLIAHKKK